jgi:23S rRNA pseudouridine2605 synthase
MPSAPVRLNKFLASCGVGSRRHCDGLVLDGQVTVNGERCTSPGTRIGEDDVVRLNRKRVSPKLTTTILINKPRGLVCTKTDELGRDTVFALLPPKLQHLNHVGRLDQDSEGLLVLTNDGDLANRLTHPRSKTEKEYLVTLASNFNNEILDLLVAGVHTPEGRAKAKIVTRLSPRRIAMVLETGLKRQIREMFKTLHHRVIKLVRVRIGSLMDPTLAPGRYRPLDAPEIELLLQNPKPGPLAKKDRSGKTRRPARKTTARKSARQRTGQRSAAKNGPRRPAGPPARKRPPGRR